jgi:hypothetical protein
MDGIWGVIILKEIPTGDASSMITKQRLDAILDRGV